MRSCKDDWHNEHYDVQSNVDTRHYNETHDNMNDRTLDRYYHETYERAHAANMTLEEYETYWMRTLAYYQTQPEQS